MRRRLAALAATTTLMVAVAFLVPLAVLVRTLARDRALSAAQLEAQSLAPVLALTSDTTTLDAAVGATAPGSPDRLTVFLPDGRTVGAPPGTSPGADANLALARSGRAFSAPAADGIEVLAPVALPGGSTAVVRVTVPTSELTRGVSGAWAVEVVLGLVLVVVAVLVADFAARAIARPVDALADAARRLGEGDLSVRIAPEGPAEVAEVAAAFNRLGDRVGQLLAAERELVADLSHRLRTPLTALRLDAEGVGAAEEARRLADDIDELERAVDAVIRQARRPVRHDLSPPADVGAVVSERLAFWTPLAEDQGRPFTVSLDPAALDRNRGVPVAAEDLQAALDALLGNVFAHTDEGTAFSVELGVTADGGTRLAVADAGPGLSPDFVERGRSGAGGTGLGLDIARRTAEGSGGRLVIDRGPSGGARVSLEFPPPPDRAPAPRR